MKHEYIKETFNELGGFSKFSFIASLLTQLFLQGESRACTSTT